MSALGGYMVVVGLLTVLHVVFEVLGVRRPQHEVVSERTGEPVLRDVDVYRVARSGGGLEVRFRTIDGMVARSSQAARLVPTDPEVRKAA